MAKINIKSPKGTEYPKDKKGWANLINEEHDNAVMDRRSYEFQWALNTAYYLGFQNLRYHPRELEIYRAVDDDLFVVNRIAPYLEQRMAKLTNIKFVPSVIADREDPLLIKAAEVNEQVFKHYWKVQDKDAKEKTLAILMLLHGSAFKKVMWNPKAGDKIAKIISPEQDLDGMARLNEDGTPETKEIFIGDIECHVRSAFSVVASPGATCIEDADWVIDRTWMTFEEAKEKWPKLDEKMAFISREPTHYEKFIRRLQSPSFSGLVGIPAFREETEPKIKEQRLVMVKEYWKKPNKTYPKGILAIVVGSQLVHFTDWPEGMAKIPFIKIDEHENPFAFYGQSTITRLLPLQRRYNEGRTQLAKNVALGANVKWAVQKGSGLHDDALTDEEGEVLEYNMGSNPPAQLNVAPLPNYVVNALEGDIRDIRDISGEREASQQPFPGLTAAVAIQEAAAQSNEVLGPTIDNIREGIEREGEIVLLLANEKYEEPRKIKIVGPNNAIINKIVDKSVLMNQTDLTIGMESGLGESKASNRQALIDLWDRRVIQDPNVLLEAYRAGKLDVATSADDPLKTEILGYIQDIKDGKMPEINENVDPIIAFKTLSEFIQTPEYKRLPEDRQAIALQVLQFFVARIQPQQQENQNPAAVGTPFGPQVTNR